MAILGYQDNISTSMENSQKFRYFLILFAIFLTVVPSGILSLTQQHQQNQNVITYTTIISQELPQEKTINGEALGGIVLTPNLTLSGDLVCVISAWIIALIGIFGLLRKNNLVGQFISIFLIAFTVLQTLSAIHTVIFSDQWIFKILSGSWKKAHLFNPELINEIQYEFSCKGFVSADDRPCGKMLFNRFGTQLLDVAKTILLARLVQLFGVLIHAHIFNRVILRDITMTYVEECECEYSYEDKEYYNYTLDNYISDDLDDLYEENDLYYEDDLYEEDSWIDPTPSSLLSKIYFDEQTS